MSTQFFLFSIFSIFLIMVFTALVNDIEIVVNQTGISEPTEPSGDGSLIDKITNFFDTIINVVEVIYNLMLLIFKIASMNIAIFESSVLNAIITFWFDVSILYSVLYVYNAVKG